MPKTQVVKTIFIGDDRLTAQVQQLGRKMGTLGHALTRPFRKGIKAANLFKSVLKSMVVFRVVSGAMSGLERSISSVTEEYISFDSAVTQAAAKFPEQIQRGTSAFNKLGEAARQIGATTKYTATEAAQGLKFLAMAGFSAEGAIAALPVVTDLATASGEDFARVSDIATDALGAFGLASSDAAKQADNLRHVSDVFSYTVNSANVTLENMYNSMRDGGPVMTSAGQSIETFGALVATMGNAGIKGSKAGTTLKNAFLRLQAPPKQAAKALAKYGIEVADKQGNMRDFLDILADMEKAFKGVNGVQRNAALSAIFGRYAVAGMSKIFTEGASTVRKFRDQLDQASGTTKETASEIEKSLENKLLKLKSSLLEVGFRVIEAFQERFPDALDTAIEAVRNFDVQPIIRGLEATIGFIKKAHKFLVEWKDEIIHAIEVYFAFKAALAVYRTVDAAVAAIIKFKTTTESATLAQMALNAAMLINPWALVAVGILVVVAALIYMYKNWDKIQTNWVKGLENMTNYNNRYVEHLADINAWVAKDFEGSWVDFKNVFIEIWNSIKQAFTSTMRYMAVTMKKMPILGSLFEGVDEGKIGVDQTAYAKRSKYTGLAARLQTKKQYADIGESLLKNLHGKGEPIRAAMKHDSAVIPGAAERGWGAPSDEALNHNLFMQIGGLPEQAVVNDVKTERRSGGHIGALTVDVKRSGRN